MIRWLKQRFTGVEFSMIVGEDAYIDIIENKWREVINERFVNPRVIPYEGVFISKYYSGKESTH